jgi:hypothetical protein
MPNLTVDKLLGAKAQSVKDQNGNVTPLALATDNVGIGTTEPAAKLHVKGAREGIRVQGPETGNANQAYVSFVDKAGTRIGYVGDGSTGDTNVFLNSDLGDVVLHTRAGRVLTATAAGNIGIGTTNPLRTLTIGSNTDAAFTIEPSDGTPNAGYIRFGDNTGWKLHFARSREASAGALNTGALGLLLTIEDQGTIVVHGDIALGGADCAEAFDVAEAHALDPGTVLVIGDNEELRQSTQAYDRRVAGVISGAGNCKPGIILGSADRLAGRRMPVALTGKVYCKVDADYAPLSAGDLLTTSPTPGHAMKADDPIRAAGAIIGKALRPFSTGQGLVPILIGLQ